MSAASEHFGLFEEQKCVTETTANPPDLVEHH